MQNTFKISTLLMAMTLTGCLTKPQIINYKNPAPSQNDAHLSFRSDFETHTYFSVNDNPVEKCADFKSIGYVLNADSIFLYDKPNKEINIKMPSGSPIAIHGYHKFSDPGVNSTCFPPSQIFTPKAGEIYEVNMALRAQKGTDGLCSLAVNKLLGDGTKTPVKTEKFGFCDTKTNTLINK